MEIRLVFGAISSQAIFNDPARMAIIVAAMAEVDADKKKVFELETEGVVLGIGYDTIAWSWWLPKEKLDLILIQ